MIQVAHNFLIRIRATANGIVDLAGNEWKVLGKSSPLISTAQAKFGKYSIYCPDVRYALYKDAGDERLYFTPDQKWTFSAWIYPFKQGSGTGGGVMIFAR